MEVGVVKVQVDVVRVQVGVVRVEVDVVRVEVGVVQVLANWRWGRRGTRLANTRWLARTWLYHIIIICWSKEIFS